MCRLLAGRLCSWCKKNLRIPLNFLPYALLCENLRGLDWRELFVMIHVVMDPAFGGLDVDIRRT